MIVCSTQPLYRYSGLSTDIKPTKDIKDASTLWEIDSGRSIPGENMSGARMDGTYVHQQLSKLPKIQWTGIMANYTDNATFGAFIKKLLTTGKFIGLK